MVRGVSRAVRAIAKANKDRKKKEEQEEWLSSPPPSGPRSFSAEVKEQCWLKAEEVKGRDPTRWRRDPVGNIVFRKLVGCSGCLCYDYDHIVPYSKGGSSTLDNCQVMQTSANRAKGSRLNVSKAELAQKSVYCKLSGRDMDMMEISAFGDVHRDPGGGGCLIQ